jgi:hypothetical protein
MSTGRRSYDRARGSEVFTAQDAAVPQARAQAQRTVEMKILCHNAAGKSAFNSGGLLVYRALQWMTSQF